MEAVKIVSLGPGQADWVTLGALRALREASLVLCPSVNGTSRAAALVSELAIDTPVELFALPMKTDRTEAMQAYDRLAARALAIAQEGGRVAIAAEGDASIYASIHNAMRRLEGQANVEQLPGVPSFIAAAALARMSLVEQHEALCVMPGDVSRIDALPRGTTVVVMKLSRCADQAKAYMTAHPERRYLYAEHLGTPQQLLLTDVTSIARRAFPYFSLLIIR